MLSQNTMKLAVIPIQTRAIISKIRKQKNVIDDCNELQSWQFFDIFF